MEEIEQTEEFEDEFLQKFSKETLQKISRDKLRELNEGWKRRTVILVRDNFKCTNEGCHYKESEKVGISTSSRLQVHHKRFRKNGGSDVAENLTTLCDACHTNFHKGKIKLRVKGQQYVHISKAVINERWQRYRKQMKEIKKYIKSNHLNEIDWELMAMILTWFFDDVMGHRETIGEVAD